MAMEKVTIPKDFIKNKTVDFDNKNLEFVNNSKNYMFGEFQLMTLKPTKKVSERITIGLCNQKNH